MEQQKIFKALADPNRRAILKALQSGSKTAGELAELFPITRASLSHHFNLLKYAGLVTARREGQHIIYSLNTTLVQDLYALFMDLFEPMKEQEDIPRNNDE